ncbi:MAG: hypothetical protein IPL58_11685 [Betaproteobacteria bacterium]|uniref:NusG-like N-terminal domain-containing protein n=1 Tax=Candidatus Proximibacter danicus TaxID=2954365 RepID=A0A9D7K1B3_9PROT|nr:hypothetical protein [Candidatus Proximibacter danicus]
MHWYLVHTKLGQERCALENLERQGYQCYLPTFPSENSAEVCWLSRMSLCSRVTYLSDWAATIRPRAGLQFIRPKGVSRLVRFWRRPR